MKDLAAIKNEDLVSVISMQNVKDDVIAHEVSRMATMLDVMTFAVSHHRERIEILETVLYRAGGGIPAGITCYRWDVVFRCGGQLKYINGVVATNYEAAAAAARNDLFVQGESPELYDIIKIVRGVEVRD